MTCVMMCVVSLGSVTWWEKKDSIKVRTMCLKCMQNSQSSKFNLCTIRLEKLEEFYPIFFEMLLKTLQFSTFLEIICYFTTPHFQTLVKEARSIVNG